MPPTAAELTDSTGKKVVAASLVTALSSGGLFTFLDSRYALASEVKGISVQVTSLADAIHADRIERAEILIEESERRLGFLELVPAASRTPLQNQMFISETNLRAKLVRRLKRLTESK
jgi:hypothetical protein